MTTSGTPPDLSARGSIAPLLDDDEPTPLETMTPVLLDVARSDNVESSVVQSGLQLVRLADSLDGDDRLALAVLVVASLVQRQRGSTRLPLRDGSSDPLDDWIERLVDEASERGVDRPAPERLRRRIDRRLDAMEPDCLLGPPGSFRPLIWTGDALYHQQLWHYERRLVDALRPRLTREPLIDPDRVERATRSMRRTMPRLEPGGRRMELNDDQRRAVRRAIRAPLTLVSGEPGTGKTAVIVSVLRAAVRLDVDPREIALAAPTGKAAERIGDEWRDQLTRIPESPSVDDALARRLPEPQTLHRLLGYSPARDTFRFGDDHPLDARLVVVDEVSMVDVYMMARLAEAVPERTRLVLIGDADQLPSVQNGAVFRDLTELLETPTAADETKVSRDGLAADGGRPTRSSVSQAASSIHLTTNYRLHTGSDSGADAILETARAINRGDAEALLEGPSPIDVHSDAERLSFEGVEYVPDPSRLGDVLSNWYDAFFDREPDTPDPSTPLTVDDGGLDAASRRRLETWFERDDRAQLLALTRVFETGTRRINRLFHRRYARTLGRRNASESFLPGEPVIVLDNDYELGLFNGDRGVVVRVERQGETRLAVAFRGRSGEYRCIDLHRLRDHVRWSYALTVHKAQGSEFDHVGLLLPNEEVSILGREILYTGLTRARRSVVIAGSKTRLQRGIERTLDRHTGLDASRFE